MKLCTCVVPNVWTSAGKVLRDEQVSLPDDEAKRLSDAGSVTFKKTRKAKADAK